MRITRFHLFVVILLGVLLAGIGLAVSSWREQREITAPQGETVKRAEQNESPAARLPSFDRTALETALRKSNPQERAQAFGVALPQAIEIDAEATLTFVLTLPDGKERETALQAVVQNLAAKDPRRALALAGEYLTDQAGAPLYRLIFFKLAQADFASALGLYDTIAPGLSRENAVRALADFSAASDLPAALAFTRALPAALQATAARVIAPSLAQQDPAAALAWAQTLSDSQARQIAWQESVIRWTDNNPMAAVTWATAQPVGAERDRSVAIVAGQLASKNPRQALTLTVTISDVASRLEHTRRIYRAWHNLNAPAANQWLAEAPIPTELRVALAPRR